MGPPGVPRVPISGPHRGIFSKLDGLDPLGSGSHSHTSFSNGRFRALETSFHIDVNAFAKQCLAIFFAKMAFSFISFINASSFKKNAII